MKIAFVNQPWAMESPPVQSGSLSIWTWEVARRLARQHDVLVYEGSKKLLRPKIPVCQGVQYRVVCTAIDELYLKIRGRVIKNEPIARQMAARSLYYFTYALQVARDIRRENCDIVHMHQCSQFASVIRALNPDARIVLHMNCEWLSQFDKNLLESRLEAPTVIMGCSDHITGLICERFPQLTDRCRTVPNGVDIDKFAPKADRDPSRTTQKTKRLVFVGRVSPEKGVHDLLEAFAIVVRRYPSVQLDIVGPEWSIPMEWIVSLSSDPLVADLRRYYEGSYRDRLVRFVDENGLTEKVRFVGKIRNDELTDCYHSADILINPSLSESFGMTVAEAMACGKPVIVTKVGGMKETVQHGYQAHGDLRGRGELEGHRRELLGVLPLPGRPPQLNKLTPFDLARLRDDGPWRAAGWSSWRRRHDGDRRTAIARGRPPVPGMTAEDERRIYYFVVWPITSCSIHPDYLMIHRLDPTGAGPHLVVCEWLFDPDTMAKPGFDPSDAVEFWDLTNRQDWDVCELQQQGTRRGRAFPEGTPGGPGPRVRPDGRRPLRQRRHQLAADRAPPLRRTRQRRTVRSRCSRATSRPSGCRGPRRSRPPARPPARRRRRSASPGGEPGARIVIRP